MTARFVLRTPSGPVRFRANENARDDEPVLVREDEPMSEYASDVEELRERVRELELESARLDERAARLAYVVAMLAEERHIKQIHWTAFEVCPDGFCKAARDA